MKLKKGDTVTVISGKDRGKSGKILEVHVSSGRIRVEGVNMRKKHRRARQPGKKGEVVNMPLSIHTSNVMAVCPKCGKPTRIGYRVNDAMAKRRVCKKCEAEF
ncbi:MAG: 50S ribosomal protein L24 [Candidatus Sungbacteria bacterium RIFCSPLOWO2_02_FULL_51_17]|uniref:Large ribosomal subunit protein uL24 n=1 Tax=Candidatus Sungbacteria bacterium RIFCSPHIGHO2_02_FULL_51_29 TaxID=1802273 RepID=A0A1G2KSR4_9BACT|nr:MAG: 50S ribosomal protein L24 [Candidatus Sungbacteria bacterium RIFCSPHIGHO2_01_FULL_51_22]OHA02486.1 MAG: 50S ribosomal protein L24 [Candidatus Sungbacteria bacterium RIFCSPHIGHO2_02_FULL_51_29]OHA07943.1 MAG: 50S ribosomal protein L24 [Candidatus Sungbacteria bacterium RIFCSPLOWO2_01_FULL_51_34]OHA11937.1 MAG: 50S ribosomal protein L24 [Candidatus Sungbacteria bacterium RIFCSPLOWO2_02_FULL_51_17]